MGNWLKLKSVGGERNEKTKVLVDVNSCCVAY